MGKLPKYTLEHNAKKNRWDLERDGTERIVRSFVSKEDATAAGVLKRAIGPEGGSVKIQKENGVFQEERTFPRSKDPRKSKG
jgi:hypothetical protein